MKTDRNKILNFIIYVVSIMILLWLLFISLKDLITSRNSFNQHYKSTQVQGKTSTISHTI